MAVVSNYYTVNFTVSFSFSVILYMFLRSLSLLLVAGSLSENCLLTYAGLTEKSDGITDHMVIPCASVYNASPVLLWARPLPNCLPFRPVTRRSMLTSFVAFLLLTVESNPGPFDVRFGFWNAASAVNKGALIDDLIRDSRLDVLAICESGIRNDAPDAIKYDIAPQNFSVLHVHRPPAADTGRCRRGGGLSFIFRDELSVTPLKNNCSPSTFELQLVGLRVGKTLVKVANVYRPPSSSKSTFLDEFADLLVSIGLSHNERLLVCGDFNMPGEDANTIDDRLSALLDEHGYQQHINVPTRRDPCTQRENILDVLITSQSPVQSVVSNIEVCKSHGMSDHDLITCNLNVKRLKEQAVAYTYRCIKNVDIVDFTRRLWSSSLFINTPTTPDEYVAQVKSTVTDILDQVAPMRSGHRPGGRNGARWLSADAVAAKRMRRRLERRWKRSGYDHDRIEYRAACRRANSLINASRNQHRYERVIAAGRDPRRVWTAVKNLLHVNRGTQCVRSADTNAAFSSTLAAFFVNKVRDIRLNIMSVLVNSDPDPLAYDGHHEGSCLSDFEPVTEDEVLRLLMSMTSKSSPLDFIPTSLLKACSGPFASIIARLANLTFETATFPKCFKTAQITPLLKQRGLDEADPSNYRPISNLNTISKILERLVLSRLVPHVLSSPSSDMMQSGYRKWHSTETALLRVTNDIFESFDSRKSTILVTLDQSAAFDCIDHGILIKRLRQTFGVTGNALNWLASYLQGRVSFVHYGNASSNKSDVEAGVPQGSVLGPYLFTLYIAPLSNVIRSFGINHHQYADDTQLYISTSKNDLLPTVCRLENCITSVHKWMLHNWLSLNPKKSDVIQFISGRGQNRVEDVASVAVSGVPIRPSSCVKSLGITFDSDLAFDQHIANVCKASYFHIRALRHIRKSLPYDVVKTVASSIVGSRMDYCNALFVGMSESNFSKLQRVQNALARVVLELSKFDHITPALIELHWLPVKHRVTFKLATSTFKILQSGQPAYLRDLVNLYEPARTLRSSTQHLLCIQRTKTAIATRSFKHSSATIWNSLPANIRDCNTVDTFKRKLKTHLFGLAFAA
jgi:Reverse transcriptase (RNA-dependent DNA polymerase)/Endonuclease-reverse transcriptase